MDIKELNHIHGKRHPWETSRLKALSKILRTNLVEGIRVLDVGCGDGFISKGLFNLLKDKMVTAVDINLSDELIKEIEKLSDGMNYVKVLPENGCFDLVLLLDVIEHVEDDRSFLAHLVDRYLSKSGKVMITVPAFQSLFSCHDTFLGHHKRYMIKGLESVVNISGLKVISSGYLFLSLLLPKFVFYKILNSKDGSDGVGQWNMGRVVTAFIEKVLNIDNNLLIIASHLGIKIPGLTAWVLCEKQG
jgi:SAM-dependent methyltransferase